jgi:hypothetical protein
MPLIRLRGGSGITGTSHQSLQPFAFPQEEAF